MKDTILLTGATGALGSMLLQRLADRGHEVVCLVRGKSRSDARRRIREIIGEHDNVKVVRGDVTEPRCGIGDLDRELLVGRVKRVLHCAASINFRDEKEVQRTNIAGLHHVLELTDVLDAWHVIYVSTAYVVGDAPYLAEDALSVNQRWHNPYEESKYIGETMVRAWALERDERRFSIFRPSILVGCEDGMTPTLDAYYKYLEPLHHVAETMREHRGKALPPDVSVRPDGSVRIPLAILMGDTRINYVPIDWAADMMTEAVELPPNNGTFHFVHHQPPKVRDCLAWSLEYLGIEGAIVCSTTAEKELAVKRQPPLVRRLQRRVDTVHDAFAPYTGKEPLFQMNAAPRSLGLRFRHPPPIDRAFLHRLLSYARQWHWDVDRRRARAPAPDA